MAFLGTGLTHGDFNGDGIGDLAVVSRSAARPAPQQVVVYLIWGGQRLVNGPIDNPAFSRCVIMPPSEKQVAPVVFAGNLDGDPYHDLILTLPGAQLEPTESGIAGCIIWGRPEWPAIMDLTNIQKISNVTFLISHRAGVYTGTHFGEVYVLLNRATHANKPAPPRSALLPVSPNPFRNVSVIWFELAQTESV